MKVILGPLPCRSCGSPVTIVRSDVEQPCEFCVTCRSDVPEPSPAYTHVNALAHTHTLPDVGPFTPVDEDGTRHGCQVSA